MTDEQKLIKLHAEVNGWKYKGAETVLEDKNVSKHTLLLWISRLEQLEKDAKRVAITVKTEQAKRGWVKARELNEQMKERLKKEYGIE